MATKKQTEAQATEEVVEQVEQEATPVAQDDPHGFFAQQQAICFGKDSL